MVLQQAQAEAEIKKYIYFKEEFWRQKEGIT